MARQRAAVKVNQFVGGFITEANPLSFPENSNYDELNFDILEDGSRARRWGFDLEDSYSVVDTGITNQINFRAGMSQFRWTNAGGDPDKVILVVQIGNYLGFHDLDSFPISGNLISSKVLNSNTYRKKYSYASIDGLLVVATGEKEVSVFEYDGSTISHRTEILYTRDLFGVEAMGNSRILTTVENQNFRPSNLTDEHLYNLRNQTFALPRIEGDANTQQLVDTIAEFYSASGNTEYPSNGDEVISHLLADPNKDSNRTVERYNGNSAYKSKPETTVAPKGYFIIDALERGQSRITQEANLRARNPTLSLAVSSLLTDRTPGGPSVVEAYAGRIWYAGFSGDVIDGDSKSPRLSSYIMYSQLVTDPTQINRCYQEAPPTSHIDSALVDTDGGFLKMEGAYNIKKMVNVQSSLFVFAENGVWEIAGIDRNSFTATGFRVNKISEEGCVSGSTVVNANNLIVYWSQGSINIINRNDYGDWVVQDLSENTIRSFYLDEISFEDKKQALGYYDPARSSIRWLYGTTLDSNTSSKELIISFKYTAFLKNTIQNSSNIVGPVSISGGTGVSTQLVSNVTVNGVEVTENSNIVTITTSTEQQANPKQYFYCIVIGTSPTITYSFGGYNNPEWYDWASDSAVDASAYIITAPNTATEARLRKDVPYLTTYYKHTGGANTSSCLVSSRWDWTTAPTTGKWSTPRETYRPRSADDGDALLATRNRIRGNGRAVSFKFETSPGKDLRLYGWDHNLEVTTGE